MLGRVHGHAVDEAAVAPPPVDAYRRESLTITCTVVGRPGIVAGSKSGEGLRL